MSTYSFPAIIPNTSRFALVSNTKLFQSPLNGSIKSGGRPGTRWEITLGFHSIQGANRSLLQGFISRLDGQRHRFTVHDHAYTMQGAGGGTPLVNGASQTGNQLATDGWPNNTLILKAGDEFSYQTTNGYELKMVTADATTNGTGQVTISVVPDIHTSPANNASLVLVNPLGRFILLDRQISWGNTPGVFSDFTIHAIEEII